MSLLLRPVSPRLLRSDGRGSTKSPASRQSVLHSNDEAVRDERDQRRQESPRRKWAGIIETVAPFPYYKWILLKAPMPKRRKNCQGPDCFCWKTKLGDHTSAKRKRCARPDSEELACDFDAHRLAGDLRDGFRYAETAKR